MCVMVHERLNVIEIGIIVLNVCFPCKELPTAILCIMISVWQMTTLQHNYLVMAVLVSTPVKQMYLAALSFSVIVCLSSNKHCSLCSWFA